VVESSPPWHREYCSCAYPRGVYPPR
jgi:hypothetical protein